MANPISGAYQAQQTEPINQTTQTNTTNKPVGQTTAAPQDTVTISKAAQAAQAAQAQQPAQQPAQTKTAGPGADHGGK
jgi:hypothetical protein